MLMSIRQEFEADVLSAWLQIPAGGWFAVAIAGGVFLFSAIWWWGELPILLRQNPCPSNPAECLKKTAQTSGISRGSAVESE